MLFENILGLEFYFPLESVVIFTYYLASAVYFGVLSSSDMRKKIEKCYYVYKVIHSTLKEQLVLLFKEAIAVYAVL